LRGSPASSIRTGLFLSSWFPPEGARRLHGSFHCWRVPPKDGQGRLIPTSAAKYCADFINAIAASAVQPSPHSPSKTGVNALMVGEGGRSERSEDRPGEGFLTEVL